VHGSLTGQIDTPLASAKSTFESLRHLLILSGSSLVSTRKLGVQLLNPEDDSEIGGELSAPNNQPAIFTRADIRNHLSSYNVFDGLRCINRLSRRVFLERPAGSPSKNIPRTANISCPRAALETIRWLTPRLSSGCGSPGAIRRMPRWPPLLQ
jgi:hypothetical protein